MADALGKEEVAEREMEENLAEELIGVDDRLEGSGGREHDLYYSQ
jgi:hypothetical protein